MRIRLLTTAQTYHPDVFKILSELGFTFNSVQEHGHDLLKITDTPVYIEINTLEELTNLYNKIKCRLIFGNDEHEGYYDRTPTGGELTLQILDDYL